jgi:hypothetical protein
MFSRFPIKVEVILFSYPVIAYQISSVIVVSVILVVKV